MSEELDAAHRRIQDLLNTPPFPTDTQFAGHLSTLQERILKTLEELEEARILSADPLTRAATGAETYKVVSLKKRFEGFRDALMKANINIGSHMEGLAAVYPLIVQVKEALSLRHLDAFIGRDDILAIISVCHEISTEESPDDVWVRRIHERNKEFNERLEMRDKFKEIDRLEREEIYAAARLAFEKYKLPPMTVFERFCALKPTGHRDGFSVD